MKSAKWLAAGITCTLLLALAACFKDSGYKTYKVYTPVFKSRQEVLNSIGGESPRPVTHPGKMFVVGNYIFLNEMNKGVHVIDNSNPASPHNIAFIAVPGCEDISVRNHILYVDCFTDLVAINISDPLHLSTSKIVRDIFPDKRVLGNFTVDTGKVVVDWMVKDSVVELDIQEGQGIWRNDRFIANGPLFQTGAPTANAGGAAPGKAGSMSRFALMNNHLYTVTQSSLNIIDISTPSDPVWKSLKHIGWRIETIYPFKNKLFIGSQTGMYTYDVANPENPVMGMMFVHARACDPVVADDNYAYVTLRSGVDMCFTTANEMNVVDVRNIQSPTKVKSYSLTNPHGLDKDGDILFICDGKAGLKIFNIANVQDMRHIVTIPMAETFDVITWQKRAIVSAKDGLYQFDYSDMQNIRLVSRIGISY